MRIHYGRWSFCFSELIYQNQTERKEIPAFVRGFFIFELMINKLYKRISRIIALLCSKDYDGRKDFEDADRLYRWLTEHYEK
mgnify:CR=1 FL=1